MWTDAKAQKPAENRWYIGWYECEGAHTCGRKHRGAVLFKYTAVTNTGAVHGMDCLFSGMAIWDVPLGESNGKACGYISHWQELPGEPV